MTLLRRLGLDRRAVASLEFVIVAPVLIGLAIGMVETVRYVRARAVLFHAATAAADLVAAQQSVTAGVGGTMQDMCKGAGYIMGALSPSSLTMSVASYTYPSGSGPVAKDWGYDAACPQAGTAPAAALTTATAMVPNRGDGVILVQASYTYVPMVSAVLPSVTFQQQAYARPRFGSVLCSNC